MNTRFSTSTAAYEGWQLIFAAASLGLRRAPESVRTFEAPAQLVEKIRTECFLKPVDLNERIQSPYWKIPSEPLQDKEYKDSQLHYEPDNHPSIIEAGELVRQEAEKFYGVKLRLCKTRVFEIVPGYIGKWHTDNFPAGVYKVLLYVNSTSKELGTTELRLADGQPPFRVEGAEGTCVLFDTNTIPHRAMGPLALGQTRKTIEFTFVPRVTPLDRQNKLPSGPLKGTWPFPDEAEVARALKLLAQISDSNPVKPYPNSDQISAVYLENYKSPPKYLNIGGGAEFNELGWHNIDGAFGLHNKTPVKFSPHVVFGYEAERFDFIYCSHTLEHLDDPTVTRVLLESHRILKRGSYMLIKFPNFGDIFENYKRNKIELTTLKSLCGVDRTWEKHGVSRTPQNIISFCLCNAWEESYSPDIYSTQLSEESGSGYFGPCPRLTNEYLDSLFRVETPHYAATKLKRAFEDFQKTVSNQWVWGHQNAWSEDEFEELACKLGFSCVARGRDNVLQKVPFGIPNFFKTQFLVSSWFLLEK